MTESVSLADAKQVEYFKTKIQNQMDDFADEAKFNTKKGFFKNDVRYPFFFDYNCPNRDWPKGHS
jgi:hypothetical protein